MDEDEDDDQGIHGDDDPGTWSSLTAPWAITSATVHLKLLVAGEGIPSLPYIHYQYTSCRRRCCYHGRVRVVSGVAGFLHCPSVNHGLQVDLMLIFPTIANSFQQRTLSI